MLHKLPQMKQLLKKCIADTFTHPNTFTHVKWLISRTPATSKSEFFVT